MCIGTIVIAMNGALHIGVSAGWRWSHARGSLCGLLCKGTVTTTGEILIYLIEQRMENRTAIYNLKFLQ
jgi:predicted DNA-binding protein with PD1-like motif